MKKKTLPQFNNESEEQKFWQNHDSTTYINWSSTKKTNFPNLLKKQKCKFKIN